MFLQRRPEIPLVLVVAILPRLVALLFERRDITEAYVDKSDTFATTFVESGTYGFIPGEPSAYTQPLYGFFLIPIYWVADRHWLAIGLAQIAVAAATAFLVYAVGSRYVSRRVGVLAALLTTLHPYLVWHDVHMNREILDQLIAVGLTLLALRLADRPRLLDAVALGAVLGLGILANARLAFLPLVVAGYVVWHQRSRAGLIAVAVAVAACAVVVAPWVVRNQVQLGCAAITTDGRALWKANNENTYETLKNGGWIDDVPPIPNAPLSPQEAGDIYLETGRVIHLDECAQMRQYQELVFDFWQEHPGEKARLAGQSAVFLWQPHVLQTEGRSGKGTALDTIRDLLEPIYMAPVFVCALVGLALVRRRLAAFVLLLLGYQTIVAMIFVGATRYRVPWDFLLMLLAAAALDWIWRRWRGRAAAAP